MNKKLKQFCQTLFAALTAILDNDNDRHKVRNCFYPITAGNIFMIQQ